MRVTINRINQALTDNGIDAEIVKGNGYYYFTGPAMDYTEETMVYVCRLSELSLDQWITEAKDKIRQ